MNRERLKQGIRFARLCCERPATEPVYRLDGTVEWVPAVVVPVTVINTLIKAATKELNR